MRMKHYEILTLSLSSHHLIKHDSSGDSNDDACVNPTHSPESLSVHPSIESYNTVNTGADVNGNCGIDVGADSAAIKKKLFIARLLKANF
jgi:hypothetical protein